MFCNASQKMIEVYTDGSWLQNDQIGGYAAAGFLDGARSPAQIAAEAFLNVDASVMEAYALYAGLHIAVSLCNQHPSQKELKLFSDNKYVVNAFGPGEYPTVASGFGFMFEWAKSDFSQSGKEDPTIWREIYRMAKDLYESGVRIEMFWVKAHVGHDRNEYVDNLARQTAIDFRQAQLSKAVRPRSKMAPVKPK